MTLAIAGGVRWPGLEPLQAHREVLDVVADPPAGIQGRPGLVMLPQRGPWAEPLARTLALCESMPASLQPHGWRLGLSPDETARRAVRQLGSDVEAFALAAHGWSGSVSLPSIGPFSLAASLWLPVGDRVIGDQVALADVLESLTLGLIRHAEQVTAARHAPTPEAGYEVVLAEPLLAQVVDGAIPTFSGLGRLRAVPAEQVTHRLARLVAHLAGHRVVVAVPAQAAVLRMVGAARPAALQLDVTALGESGWEALAEQVEAGIEVRCAVVPAVPGDAAVIARSVAERWRGLGLPIPGTRGSGALTLLPRSGLVDLSPSDAQATLRLVARCAVALGELLAG